MDRETVFTPELDIGKLAPVFPDNLGNLSEITNVLLISREISNYSVFYDSVNSNTLPIVYCPFTSTKEEVSAVLGSLSSIQRIGIVFHSSSGSEKMFLDGKSLFTYSDITESVNHSENVTWLLQTIRDYNVKNVDFLACDSLNYPNWVSYFDLLHTETGVVVGASNDKTGNIKYGGDWVMESTGEDIELVYFTSSIEYYKYLLYLITINGINYDVNDTTLIAAVHLNPNAVGSVVIPSTIFYSVNGKTYDVKSTQPNAFRNCSTLTSIVLPNSLNELGANSFFVCQNLTSVVLSNNIKIIRGFTFLACVKLEFIEIPEGITDIQNNAFQSCIIMSPVLLPNTLKSIEKAAFKFCSGLKTITIPGSVTNIGEEVFDSCVSLTEINILNGVVSLGDKMLNNCENLTKLLLPNSVTDLARNQFDQFSFGFCAKLTTIAISSGLTSLKASDFFNLPLLKTYGFKHTTRLPTMISFDSSAKNKAFYRQGVLPPVGQGTDPAVFLNSRGFTPALTENENVLNISNITVNGISVQTESTTLVKNTVETAVIVATPQDPNSSVAVGENPILTLGVNTYPIIVTSFLEDTATYYVYVFQLEPNCFLEGTKILCLVDNEEKYIPIETMRKGTQVKTLASGYKDVEMIGHSTIYNPGNNLRSKDRLFKCSKSAYPELTEDLILTGCHSILVGYLTEEQRALSIELTRDIYVTEDRYRLIACLDDRAQPYEEEGTYKIWHVALENPNIFENYGMFANGLLVESMSIRMMINFSGKELVM